MSRRRALALAVGGVAVLATAGSGTAAAAPRMATLTVVGSGASGGVASTDHRIACGSTCSASYTAGAVITLQATIPADFTFLGWSRGCVGTVPECVIAARGHTVVDAAFARAPGFVYMTVSGPGAIVSAPSGILCGAQEGGWTTDFTEVASDQCSGTFGAGAAVMLTPQPVPGAVFVSWGGACAAAPATGCAVVPGTLTPSAADPSAGTAVSATFAYAAGQGPLGSATAEQPLTVSVQGSSAPAGDCATAPTPPCSGAFAPGTSVTLGGATSWSGACVGVVEPCTLVVDAPTAVVAGPPIPRTTGHVAGGEPAALNVTTSGTGFVEGGGIHCGTASSKSSCTGLVSAGTLALTAVPAHGGHVTWYGHYCKGAKPKCTLNVVPREDALIAARFSAG